MRAILVAHELAIETLQIARDRLDQRPFRRPRHRAQQREVVGDVATHQRDEKALVRPQRHQLCRVEALQISLKQLALARRVIGDVVTAPVAIEKQRRGATSHAQRLLRRFGDSALVAFAGTNGQRPRSGLVLPARQQPVLQQYDGARVRRARVRGVHQRRARLVDERLHHNIDRLPRRRRHRAPEIFSRRVAP